VSHQTLRGAAHREFMSAFGFNLFHRQINFVIALFNCQGTGKRLHRRVWFRRIAYFSVNFHNEVRLKPTERACDYWARENNTMRFLIFAVTSVSALAFASGAFAQAAPQSFQAPPPSGGTGGGLETEQRGTRTGLQNPTPTSRARPVLCLPTGAMFALAALRRAGRTSRLAQRLCQLGDVGCNAASKMC
jgi:hypothetical protein